MVSVRSTIALTLPALLLALAACSPVVPVDTPTAPASTGGWLTLQLTTPRTDDGAVQFSVTGPGIDSVKILTYNGFATVDGGSANLLVTGQVVNGDVARIHVPDVSATIRYQATVSAAAARQNYSMQVLDGYRAVLVR